MNEVREINEVCTVKYGLQSKSNTREYRTNKYQDTTCPEITY